MTDQDKEYLRDLFAMFAMQKIRWKKGEEAEDAEDCYVIADAMLEARNKKEPKMGITAVEPKRRSK